MSDEFLWWRDGIIYQIYPRSFADSNGDGIGDLQGIISKLDYLQDLGVDAIWLSPINPSPDVDFGYDVSNYLEIDPKYGSLEDFDDLLQAAHQHSIRVILDLVLNHTSDQHPWFVQARSSRDNPYHDWYLWKDPAAGGRVPNNWQAVFGGRAWEYDPTVGQYYYHMFYKQQPDVNWRNPEVRQALLDVFRFWAGRGVDGFRLDVYNVYFKDAHYRNNPSKMGIRGFDRQEHLYDCDQPELIPLLQEIRQVLDGYPQRYAVGETFNANPRNAAQYCQPGLLHQTFNFAFLLSPWKPARFLKAIQEWEGNLAPESTPTYVLNNHDNPRSATRYARGEDDEINKVAAALLLTQRGTPFLYYGEEIGMRDVPIPRSQIQDPVGKRFWPFYAGRDGCRSPMQWDSSPHAGFTRGEPWLPAHTNAAARNAVSQRANSGSLWHFYQSLIQLRKSVPALRDGMFLPLTFDPKTLLAYLRQTQEDTIMVILNFSRRPVKFALGGEVRRAAWELLLSNKRTTLESLEKPTLLPLLGHEALILRQKQ